MISELSEYAIGNDDVEVHVQVDEATEALHEHNRAHLRRAEPTRARATRRCHAPIALTASPPTQLAHAGSRASRSRSGLGTVNTHCRYGARGSTRSTRCAAVSIRRAVHDGQIPRRLHENDRGRNVEDGELARARCLRAIS